MTCVEKINLNLPRIRKWWFVWPLSLPFFLSSLKEMLVVLNIINGILKFPSEKHMESEAISNWSHRNLFRSFFVCYVLFFSSSMFWLIAVILMYTCVSKWASDMPHSVSICVRAEFQLITVCHAVIFTSYLQIFVFFFFFNYLTSLALLTVQ